MAKFVKNIFSIASLVSAFISAGMFSTTPEKFQAQFNKIVHPKVVSEKKIVKQPTKKHVTKARRKSN